MKKYLLGATFLFVMLAGCLSISFACEQHFPDGSIGNCPDQSCTDFIDPGDGTYCVECPAAFYNPNTTYITYNKQSGEAWIITGKKPVRIMSDTYAVFAKNLFNKYGKTKRDRATILKIKNEYAAFFKTDNKRVSEKRLNESSKILNLKVRNV